MRKYNIICFGYDPWSHMWKRNQTMMFYLSKLSWIKKVIFINSPVWLSALIQQPKKELSHISMFQWKKIIPLKVENNVTVFTPLYLPLTGKINVLSKTNKVIWRLIISFLNRNDNYILLINNPEFDRKIICLLKKRAALTIFDWSDDFAEFSNHIEEKQKTKLICDWYVKDSDVIFAVNDNLRNRALKLNNNVYTILNATNFDNLNKASLAQTEIPMALSNLQKPVIGYMGWINRIRLDMEIIEYIITQRPNWTFLFIGPKSQEHPLSKKIVSSLNVLVLPPVDYFELPRYLKLFDVCILPNKINEHTKGNNPIKIYDYLATGKPIVTTATAGTEGFKDILNIAENKEEFLSMIEKAINGKDDRTMNEKRLARAKEHSWENRMKEVIAIIKKHINKK
jgi:glycosyltransferase involved in cell wall biosynthesis